MKRLYNKRHELTTLGHKASSDVDLMMDRLIGDYPDADPVDLAYIVYETVGLAFAKHHLDMTERAETKEEDK